MTRASVQTLFDVLRRARAQETQQDRTELLAKALNLLGMEDDQQILIPVVPESVQKWHRLMLLDAAHKLGIPIHRFEPSSPNYHVVVQDADGRILDPTETHMMDHPTDTNATPTPMPEAQLMMLLQAALSPFAEHADRIDACPRNYDDAEPASTVRSSAGFEPTVGDMRMARDLWNKLARLLSSTPSWGVWADKGQCWAKNGRYPLLYATEEDAKRVADEWSDREPARRHGYVWVPKRYEEATRS
jgi:hypothetical protein